MKKIHYLFSLVALSVFGLTACNKSEIYPVSLPDSQSHFLFKDKAVLDVQADTTISIPVGVTQAMNSERTATIAVTSPTGAVAGTHYTLSTNTVSFSAGEVIDSSLRLTALAAPYADGTRIDTLYVTLTTPDITPMAQNDSFMVVLRHVIGGCNEGAPALNALLGDYANTMEDFDGGEYGPYTTSITSVVPVTATSAKIGIENIWDTGWGPIYFTLDWSNPDNPTTTVIAGDVSPSDGGDLSSTYAGQTVAVRPHANQPTGTYSACDQTFTVYLQLGISGLGYFGGLYRVDLAR